MDKLLARMVATFESEDPLLIRFAAVMEARLSTSTVPELLKSWLDVALRALAWICAGAEFVMESALRVRFERVCRVPLFCKEPPAAIVRSPKLCTTPELLMSPAVVRLAIPVDWIRPAFVNDCCVVIVKMSASSDPVA